MLREKLVLITGGTGWQTSIETLLSKFMPGKSIVFSRGTPGFMSYDGVPK